MPSYKALMLSLYDGFYNPIGVLGARWRSFEFVIPEGRFRDEEEEASLLSHAHAAAPLLTHVCITLYTAPCAARTCGVRGHTLPDAHREVWS